MSYRKTFFSFVLACTATSLPLKQSSAQSLDPFIGQIMWVGFNFCPRDFAPANGQLLSIQANTALFSVYGTLYGGDGRSTFGLPDLRGRTSIHQGQGPGLRDIKIGNKGGSETITLNTNQIPSHNHSIKAGDSASTTSAMDSIPGSPKKDFYTDVGAASTTLAGNTVSNTGGNEPIDTRAPFLAMQACVALRGIFPSRF